MKHILSVLSLITLFAATIHAQTQGQVIDEIAAVVGENIIMQSEIEVEFQQLQKDIGSLNDSARCAIMRQKIVERMLLTQAQWDSIPLGEERVDYELDKRI